MSEIFTLRGSTLFEGDALTVLRRLPPGSVRCVVTSPPYWGLRDYGIEEQIGLEGTFVGSDVGIAYGAQIGGFVHIGDGAYIEGGSVR